MGAGHTHLLHLNRDSLVHRLAPEVKIAAMVLFTIIVVITPREEFWAFGGYAVLLAVVAALARVRPGWLLKRSLIEVPFVEAASEDWLAQVIWGQRFTVDACRRMGIDPDLLRTDDPRYRRARELLGI